MTWTQRPQRAPFTGTPASNDEQTLRLLGPFTIAHDSEEIDAATTSGHVVCSIPAGVMVLNVLSRATVAWDQDTDLHLFIENAARSDSKEVALHSLTSVDPAAVTLLSGSTIAAGSLGVWLIVEDCYLSVWIEGDPEAPTAGEAEIYVLVSQ